VGGDRDEYIRLEAFLQIYRLIPHAELAILPSCGHVGLIENVPFFESNVLPFLLKKQSGKP
jgi:pimeloyl-ACP methyl ester carboxylesterase